MKLRHYSAFLICSLLLSPALPKAAKAQGVTIVGSQTRWHTLKPGEKVSGRILLQNHGSVPARVRISAMDYSFYADGRTNYSEPAGQAPRSNASWIQFAPRALTLAPGETGGVDYAMAAPKDDHLKGTYWSVLMVEPLAPSALDAPKKQPGKSSLGLQAIVRYAIQIVANIGDSGETKLQFRNLKRVVLDGKNFLLADVENVGDRVTTPQIWAELFDKSGVSLGRADGGRLRIYPGCSARFRMDLSSLPKGGYSGLLVADNGDEHVFGTKITLEIQ